jgi:hypothetical protein
MRYFAPSQRQNRRLPRIGRGQRHMPAFAGQRQPATVGRQQPGDAQAGSRPEHGLGGERHRCTAADLPQFFGRQMRQGQGQCGEIVKQHEARQPQPLPDLRARKGPRAVGQAHRLAVAARRNGQSRRRQARRLFHRFNLVEIGTDGLHRPDIIGDGQNAHGTGRAVFIEHGKARMRTPNVGNEAGGCVHRREGQRQY